MDREIHPFLQPLSHDVWFSTYKWETNTIDSDYRGEIGIILINHSKSAFEVTEGMRIAQAVITKVEKAVIVERDELPDTLRGEGGFGHTGMK